MSDGRFNIIVLICALMIAPTATLLYKLPYVRYGMIGLLIIAFVVFVARYHNEIVLVLKTKSISTLIVSKEVN